MEKVPLLKHFFSMFRMFWHACVVEIHERKTLENITKQKGTTTGYL